MLSEKFNSKTPSECFDFWNLFNMWLLSFQGISKDSSVKQDLYYPPSSLVVHSAANRDQLISYITIGFEVSLLFFFHLMF